jgi:hypothetical protein
MKTVIAAVNSLKGDLNNSYLFDSIADQFLVNDENNEYICQSSNTPCEYAVYVCTVDQFNQCVDEMATNFGTSKQTFEEYKNDYGSAQLRDEPVTVPTYTQAMADNGVLPSVGMEVLVRGDKRVILLGADSDGDYITLNKEGSYDFDSVNQFKPLTPPIELIHGEAYQFTSIEDNTIKGIYSEDEHSFTGTCVEWSVETCTNIQPLTVEVKS